MDSDGIRNSTKLALPNRQVGPIRSSASPASSFRGLNEGINTEWLPQVEIVNAKISAFGGAGLNVPMHFPFPLADFLLEPFV